MAPGLLEQEHFLGKTVADAAMVLGQSQAWPAERGDPPR